ncbi:MAG: DUF4197 domain-containing protein [Deltaproteobacteria bacterium]
MNGKWAGFLVLLCLMATPSRAGFFDDVLRGIGRVVPKAGPSDSRIIEGLKEALTLGTDNAVTRVSAVDGYFADEAIRILMPDKVRKVADVLGKIGYRRQVDEFVLSMNRAAEKAAPRAKAIFVGAIREMTFEDARKILHGGDTAATDYFREKTGGKLYEAFEPVIASSMDEVGATRRYKDLMAKYASIPFVNAESMDLDRYVTNKALDGLFYMVGREERRIRTDPAARVTDLLKEVFGSR